MDTGSITMSETGGYTSTVTVVMRALSSLQHFYNLFFILLLVIILCLLPTHTKGDMEMDLFLTFLYLTNKDKTA